MAPRRSGAAISLPRFFHLIDLGPFRPGESTGAAAYGLDPEGRGGLATGAMEAPGGSRGFIAQGRRVTLLQAPSGATAEPRAVEQTPEGVLAAGSMTAPGGQVRPTLWRNGEPEDLGTLGGSLGYAYDVRDGAVVGATLTADPRLGVHATLWKDGLIRNLGALPGGGQSLAFCRDGEHTAGESMTRVDGVFSVHAALWSDGSAPRDLGTLGGPHSSALGVASGPDGPAAAGGADLPDGREHAFVWRDGEMQDLGVLPGGRHSRATAINRSGWIAGISDRGGFPSRAGVLWAEGRMLDLNSMLGRRGRFWRIIAALDLDETGRIAGSALNRMGMERAVVLVPRG